MTETRLRLGETLVEAGVISADVLKRTLELQQERQLRLGTILLQEGFVTESQLVQALSLKLSIPWVSLWRVDIPDELLEMVPVNVAEEFFLMPIYIRTTKGGERALYVAMNDPTDDNALRFVTASAGMPVKPMIAGPSDIAAAIRFYYYGEEDVAPSVPPPAVPVAPPTAGQTVLGDSVAAPPPPPAASAKSRPSKPLPPRPFVPQSESVEEEIEEIDDTELEDEPDEAEASSPAAASGEADAGKEEEEEKEKGKEEEKEDPGVEGETVADETGEAPESEEKVFADRTSAQREAERRLFGVGRTRPSEGFALTLLDGTQISFGAPSKKTKASTRTDAGPKLTKEDLLAGLKAAAQGNPLDDFLPSDRWEAYVAALLGVLMRKHLVFFEEISKELESISGKPEA